MVSTVTRVSVVQDIQATSALRVKLSYAKQLYLSIYKKQAESNKESRAVFLSIDHGMYLVRFLPKLSLID